MPIPPRDIFRTALRMWEVGANDQIFQAATMSVSGGLPQRIRPVRISDIGQAQDSVEDLRNSGYATQAIGSGHSSSANPAPTLSIRWTDSGPSFRLHFNPRFRIPIDVKVAMDADGHHRARPSADTEKTCSSQWGW